ncbi:MAG: hypothetical protein FJW31_03945 [Acidobacteria bacterium]|nr:hypothetical protein [Acidobacteriota bacterium]
MSDLGQMVLMFTRSQLKNVRFSFQGERAAETPGGAPVAVVRYKQEGGDDQTGARVYADHELHHLPLEGERWVRASDGVPVRITTQVTAREAWGGGRSCI